MSLIETKIIAPDSSHWAKWIDSAAAPEPERRLQARTFHSRLINRGRIPLLSWHHLEELLGGEDDELVQARVRFLQELPLLAWLCMQKEEFVIGSIAQVLAAEAVAACEGRSDLISIRDRARTLLLRTGPGFEALGENSLVWETVRSMVRPRRNRTDLIAVVAPLTFFDENRTIGEISKLGVNPQERMRTELNRIHPMVLRDATRSTGGDATRAKMMADEFMESAVAMMPPPGTSVRELLVRSLVSQGLDEEEVRDECVLSDLTQLAPFRGQLRTVMSETGFSFAQLKQVPMENLPSRVIGDALKSHGQLRQVRPGSDVIDGHLAVLAAYCAILYVDKRTAEDFRRAQRKEPRLEGLIGDIAKAADFEGLLV